MCKFVAAVRFFAQPLMQKTIWSEELKSVIIFLRVTMPGAGVDLCLSCLG
ncbi:hypothetical protein GYH30_002282 [Glycine max]|nr:hypothetical protein GYH30_002282 [Glycine max]